MKRGYLLLVFALVVACKANEKTPKTREFHSDVSFYVGSYTGKESKGIYKYALQKEGVLKEMGLVAKTLNPSFLTKTTNKKTLLAVNEMNENGTGSISSYSIEKDSLRFISRRKTGGGHPCFVAVSESGFVIAANYTGGNIGLLKVDNNGELSELLDVQQHFGKGTTERQQEPHAHSTWFHPTKRNEVISVDLGTNQLWFSAIDTNNNEFVFSNKQTLKMANGAGPRHLSFHPNNKWIYVLNELNNTVSLLTTKNGNYVVGSSMSTLPEDFKAYSKSADIHISNDGKFLYTSNRGHESIAVFEVNLQNGSLKVVEYQPVYGKTPRNFSLSPDNNFLLVANQDSNSIVCFKRNFSSGKLQFVSKIYAPKPVCILF
jgi:6-phosphogluconolactonase